MDKIDKFINKKKSSKKKKKTIGQLFLVKCPKNKGKECKCKTKKYNKY